MQLRQPAFLPTTLQEMRSLGWETLDVLLVTGDAYVDHPSFAAALLGRWLVAHGFRTGVVAQPRWNTTEDILRMGRPLLFAGVTAGALDSMLAHYTAFRKKRHDDAYTPGGRAGARPNRAAIVYSNLVRQAFPGLPVVLGGIEASLRRISHYDFWSDSLRRPILLDSKADVLVYGMGERPVLQLALAYARARESETAPDISGVQGTARMGRPEEVPEGAQVMGLPSHEDILADPRLLMRATLDLEKHVQRADSWARQQVGQRTLLVAPPGPVLTTSEMDRVYDLPFSRRAHPGYTQAIPAEEMMRSSINTHRGCGGGCSFCSLALHQGRRVSSRSRASILKEVQGLTRLPGWTGSVSDVGGPTANMWGARCTLDPARCTRTSCLFPTLCKGFQADQGACVDLLREVARQPGVRHVRVASGVRHDLALQDPRALKAYTMEFTGGQLKVAPEHLAEGVLRLMRKPSRGQFEKFLEQFQAHSVAAGKEQYVVPYLISAFPGCTDQDMRELAEWLRRRGWTPRQVQCFIPTPGTVATAMYYAGIDPEGHPIHVARSDAERLRQHGILSPERGRKPERQDRPNHARAERQGHPGPPARTPVAGAPGLRQPGPPGSKAPRRPVSEPPGRKPPRPPGRGGRGRLR